MVNIIIIKRILFYFIISSTVGASTLQQHAAAFLSRVGTTYGDAVLTEFDDPVLQEHVDSIALCDAKVHSV